MTRADPGIGDVLRPLVPQVLGALVRRYGRFDACEDAVQEALLAATVQWPGQGVPDNPVAWLQTVAVRRLTDDWRSESSRRNRETTFFVMDPDQIGAEGRDAAERRNSRRRHAQAAVPVLPPGALGAVAGGADPACGRRPDHGADRRGIPGAGIDHGATDQPGQAADQGRWRALRDAAARASAPERQQAVLHVLYLVFNEGYTASSGPDLLRGELTAEAIRLTRTLHRLLPGDGEVTGLLALMLLTDAHRAARTGPGGTLVPLAEQDRARWNPGTRRTVKVYSKHGLVAVRELTKNPG